MFTSNRRMRRPLMMAALGERCRPRRGLTLIALTAVLATLGGLVCRAVGADGLAQGFAGAAIGDGLIGSLTWAARGR